MTSQLTQPAILEFDMPIVFHQADLHQIDIHHIQHVSIHRPQSQTIDPTDANRLTKFLITQARSNTKPNLSDVSQYRDQIKQGNKMNDRGKLISDNTTISSTATSEESGQPQVYYTQEFGYERLPATLDGLKYLLADEAVSFFDHSPDLANFYNAIYAQFGEEVLKQIANAHLLPRSVSGRHYRESVYGRPDRTFYNSNGEVVLFVPGAPNIDGDQPAPESVHYPRY
jgi:hypothetical protein